jgi:hypothetical protein
MATWRAECWLGSNSGRQTLEVQASTSSGAKEQLERVYGAQSITNLRKVSSNNTSSSISSGDSEGLVWLLGIGFVLYLFVTYWYIAIPIGIILGILIVMGMTE